MLDAVDVFPQARLIDIGCGSGSVALGVAIREPSAEVFAIDSNARAIDCVQRGIKLNGIENLQVQLNHDGALGKEDSFDMALANPPYFADFRIAEQFLKTALSVLRTGGRLVLVTTTELVSRTYAGVARRIRSLNRVDIGSRQV